MKNGKMLVAGGVPYLSNSALYDPATNAWTTAGSSGQWSAATAALLTNGKVLHAGGADADGRTATCRLYDPVTGQWTPTGGMNNPRSSLVSVVLPNGKVLVVGGQAGNQIPGELYDPATGQWTLSGLPVPVRSAHTLTLLRNGQVLIAGGAGTTTGGIAACHLYTP
ncbi:MAG: hypothetical protein H7Z75_17175 [Ferruginibacter sp.]|nr:hypothetical protein [Cytophagales bacterium]